MMEVLVQAAMEELRLAGRNPLDGHQWLRLFKAAEKAGVQDSEMLPKIEEALKIAHERALIERLALLKAR